MVRKWVISPTYKWGIYWGDISPTHPITFDAIALPQPGTSSRKSAFFAHLPKMPSFIRSTTR